MTVQRRAGQKIVQCRGGVPSIQHLGRQFSVRGANDKKVPNGVLKGVSICLRVLFPIRKEKSITLHSDDVAV